MVKELHFKLHAMPALPRACLVSQMGHIRAHKREVALSIIPHSLLHQRFTAAWQDDGALAVLTAAKQGTWARGHSHVKHGWVGELACAAAPCAAVHQRHTQMAVIQVRGLQGRLQGQTWADRT